MTSERSPAAAAAVPTGPRSPRAPRAARLSLFGHAAAAVPPSPPGPPPRGRQREAGAPCGDRDACGRGSPPVPTAGEAGDLLAAPPQRLRWLRRRSMRKPTKGASAGRPPWPTAPAACWRAWTSWSSGERRRGRGRGRAWRGGGGTAPAPAAARKAARWRLVSDGAGAVWCLVVFSLLAREKTHST